MELKQAMEVLTKELRRDKVYLYAWQSNIAMSFYDVLVLEGYKLPNMHRMSNRAAKLFLSNLMRIRPAAKAESAVNRQTTAKVSRKAKLPKR
jgi:hypothetical protein